MQIFIEDLLCIRHSARYMRGAKDKLGLAFALSQFTDQWIRQICVSLTAIQER